MPEQDAGTPDPETTGRFAPQHSDPETKRASEEAFTKFVRMCSAKIKEGAWGRTALIFDWKAGQIVDYETEDNTTVRVTRKRAPQ